jgi:hypothetical protein
MEKERKAMNAPKGRLECKQHMIAESGAMAPHLVTEQG